MHTAEFSCICVLQRSNKVVPSAYSNWKGRTYLPYFSPTPNCARTHIHIISSSLTKHIFCSPVGGASVYQSVRCVSLHPGSDMGCTPSRDSEWTHPRIQGDTQETITLTSKQRENSLWQTQKDLNIHRWVLILWVFMWLKCSQQLFCLYLKCLSSCLGGVLLCCTFKCPIETKERERIKL